METNCLTETETFICCMLRDMLKNGNHELEKEYVANYKNKTYGLSLYIKISQLEELTHNPS